MKTDHQGPTPLGQQEPDLPVAPKLGILYDPPRPSQPSLPGATWSGYHSSGPGSGEPIWGGGGMGTQPAPKGRSSAGGRGWRAGPDFLEEQSETGSLEARTT